MPNTINISKNMRFFVYIIGTKHPKARTYVGWSNDVKKRLKAHNESKGAKFTRGRKWMLVYKEKLMSKKEAISREYYIKNNRTLRNKIKNEYLNPITL